MHLILAYYSFIFLSFRVCAKPHYKLDPSWSPNWPSSIDLNGVTAVATVLQGPSGGKEIHIAQHGTPSVLVFDSKGVFLRSWGAKGIDKAHGLKAQHKDGETFLWLTDMGIADGKYGHTISKYSVNGTLLLTLGTPGEEGTGKNPIQFGNVADIAFDNHGNMFVSDGDGGVNNRVVKFNSNLKIEFIIEHDFLHPHSVTYDKLDRVWVADREHNQTQVFNGLTGKYLGSWKCTQEATSGRPWGLRILGTTLFVVDGTNGALVLLELPGQPFDNTCNQYQVIPINQTQFGNPHEMSIDPTTGAAYVADVDDPKKPTGCLRFIPSE